MNFSKLIKLISFNEEYLIASVVYLGLAFCVIGFAPESYSVAQGDGGNSGGCTYEYTWYDESGPQTETRPGCPEGQMCCEETEECVTIE